MHKPHAPQQFDARFYRRFYLTAATRVTSRVETERRTAVIAAILIQLEQPVKRILDMGCGLGWFKKPLLQAFPKAAYTGVEYGEYLCRKLGWEQGSAADYQPHDGSQFDLVICNDVLQYLDDATATLAIRNLARLCRGALYLHVPTKRDWRMAMDPDCTDDNVHVRTGEWYQRQLRRRFRHIGNGVLMKKDVEILQWEMEAAWK